MDRNELIDYITDLYNSQYTDEIEQIIIDVMGRDDLDDSDPEEGFYAEISTPQLKEIKRRIDKIINNEEAITVTFTVEEVNVLEDAMKNYSESSFTKDKNVSRIAKQILHKITYSFEESCKLTIKENRNNKIDFMGLPTSERLDVLTKLFDEYPYGVSTEQAMKWLENNGFYITNYTNEQFNDDWDDWLSFYDYEEDNDVVDTYDEIETKEDAYRWLQDKIAEYGNTRYFNNEDEYKLNKLIDRFGNTYFWRR